MSAPCTYRIGPAGQLQLEGELTFDSATGLFRQADSVLSADRPPQTIDLSSVTTVDSAGLALLLEWQARRKRGGGTFLFTNAPESLLSLASLCEASELLNLSGRDEA